MPNVDLALIICKQGADRETIVASVRRCGLRPICCSSVEEACTLLPGETFKMVLCSEALRDGDFQAVLKEAHKSEAHLPVIVLGRSCEWDSYLKGLGAGAYDYIVCPPNPVEVERIIWLALANTFGSERESRAAA
jgi:DNA-binding NtrC family response regulator